MTLLNETLSLNPTVKNFLIVREKAKMNRDNPIGVACRNFRQITIPLFLLYWCATNNALRVLSSSTKSTIRDFRIVQNVITLSLYAGKYVFGIESVVREFLTTALISEHLNYQRAFYSVIRKFRTTDISLNKVNYSYIKETNNEQKCLTSETITQRRNYAC